MEEKKTCGCGGHHHEHAHGEGCGCGGHHHEHAHGEGCGCGGHHHEHAHGEGCGCGGHHHEHAHGEGCGCGGHGTAPDQLDDGTPIVRREATTNEMLFLQFLLPVAPFPVANYLVTSSKESDFCNVALRDVCLQASDDSVETIKEMAAFLHAMAAADLIEIDYEHALCETSYAHFTASDSYHLLKETVAQASGKPGFWGDAVQLEKGCLYPTDWGQKQLEAKGII